MEGEWHTKKGGPVLPEMARKAATLKHIIIFTPISYGTTMSLYTWHQYLVFVH